MLVLGWGRVVSVDSLVDAVWGDRPPSTARTQVAICVGALRKAFRAAGHQESVILTVYPGYQLRTERGVCDAKDFAGLVAEAGENVRRNRVSEAASQYRRALDRWTGPALAGVTGQPVQDEATRLGALRLAAYEAWFGIELDLGRHQELIPELSVMVRDHPLHEQLRYNLMLAQYRAGRRAEAAEAFRSWRQHFVDELGIEPGPSIQRLHRAILQDDPGLAPRTEVDGPSDVFAMPTELPAEVTDVLGRDVELSVLDRLLRREPGGTSSPLGFVTGPPGAGKTSLVVHWAHRVAKVFRDGQLYVDLSEYSRHQETTMVHTLLGRFLRALDVPESAIPEGLEERVASYRAHLADRRVLVVLDNVPAWAQPRSFLPGAGRSCLLVTSREQRDHLALGGHAVRVELGVLPVVDAVELVARIAGAERIAGEGTAAEELCRLCDGLPLALRIAASRLAAKPHWSVRHMVHRLSDERGRLDELVVGDLDVRAGFESGYRGLSEEAARMYRALGQLDVSSFPAWVGAALLDVREALAEDLIERLVDAHMLVVAGADSTGTLRYGFHDLLRLYAREQADAVDSDVERRAGLERVFRVWSLLAREANAQEYGDFVGVRERPPLHPMVRRFVDERLSTPLGWFEAERYSIIALIPQMCRLGMEDSARDLARFSMAFFEQQHHHDEDWRGVRMLLSRFGARVPAAI